jgi:glyoxylase-like metal-dependent hydrolase (beta-lactamase superfamily II)
VEILELRPELYLLRFSVGQAYLWHDAGELTLIDTGPPGSGDTIAETIRSLGHEPSRLARVVLTHCHGDHTGSAAEIRAWSDAPIIAHRLDAPIIRGEAPAKFPVLTDWERPLFERVGNLGLMTGPPVDVDQEVEDGDVLEFGGGAKVLLVPGHTDGSIALHLAAHSVLFTGDTIAEFGGEVILGVFNIDRAAAIESARRQAELDVDVACFGHGEPVLSGAGKRLRELSAQLSE